MKSLPNTQPNARKFPLVDYHYHASMLNGSTAPCLQTSKSMRDITRDYFDAEANREFLSEAAVFTALIGMAIAIAPGRSRLKTLNPLNVPNASNHRS